MKYVLLGRSGLRVSELCLGSMTFGKEMGDFGADKDESQKIFDAFVAADGNFINSANRYMLGGAEKMVGEFIAGDRDGFVIATKYTMTTNPDDPNAAGNHRKNMMQAVAKSLERLNTSYIDLLLIHAWDPATPVVELMRGLDDLVKAGKVLYVGVSDTPAYVVAQANTIAELRGWTPFIAYEIPYSLAQRTVEREMIPMANDLGISVTPWSPLGAGVLTGKYSRETGETRRLNANNPRSQTWLTERNLSIATEVERVAAEIGCKPAQVALSWVRQQPTKKPIIPILGARTEEQIIDNLGCLNVELSREQLDALSEVSKIDMGFPREMFGRTDGNSFMWGN